MAYEITRDLPLEDVVVETPIQKTTCKRLAGEEMLCLFQFYVLD